MGGTRKNALNNCLLQTPLLGNRDKWGSLLAVENKEKYKKKTMLIPLKIGAWNARSQMGSVGSDRPQRRMALVGIKLVRFGIEIATLSETRFAEEAKIQEVGAGHKK